MTTRIITTIVHELHEPEEVSDPPTIDELVWLAEHGEVTTRVEPVDD